MLINKEKFKLSITEIILLIAAVIFMIGIRTWFSVCPLKSETIMTCHWAGQMLKMLSLLILVLTVIHILIGNQQIKLGMDIAIIGISLVTILVPGYIINICQSSDMACRHMTRPWNIILCAAILIIAAADLILYASSGAAEKHHRKVN